MLAIVDGVPRTLSLDGFITRLDQPPGRRDRASHAVPPSQKAEERAHILRGYLKALDALDAVIALIRKSAIG
jgi:DNA gyrase subunit A